MSVAIDPVPWSRRRLIWCVFLMASLQVALIWRFSDMRVIAPTTVSDTAVVRYIPTSADPGREWFHLDDPALFALIHPHGFSGTAWLRLTPFPFQLTNRVEPPEWLEASAGEFARDLAQFSYVEEPSWIAAVRNWSSPFPNPPQSTAARVAQPHLRIEGGLEGRPLISSGALPAGDPERASKCVVQVAVDAAGDVISHHIAASSGSPIADQQAREFARTARFAPVDDDSASVTFGYLVFHWFAARLDARSAAGSR